MPAVAEGGSRKPGRRSVLLTLYGLVLAGAGVALMTSLIPSGEAWPVLRSVDPLVESIAAIDEEGAPPFVQPNRQADGGGPFDGVPTEERLDELAAALDAGPGGVAVPEPPAPADRAKEGEQPEDPLSPGGTPAWQTINFGGEAGLFVFVPTIAEQFGLTPGGGMRLLYLLLLAIPLLAYPLVIDRITGSVASATMIPAGLLVVLSAISFAVDMYWVQAWAALTLLPLVWLLITRQRWGRRAIAVLVLVGIGASLASSLRGLSGAPIVLVALVAIALRHEITRPRRGGLALLLLVAYLSVIPIGTGLMRGHAESWADDNGGLAETPAPPSNFIWHNAYIGLGYLPNDEDITYSDVVAYLDAREVQPDVYPYTREYATILRDLYLDEIGDDPVGFVELELKKAIAVLNDHPRELLLLLLLLPAGLLLRGVRERIWTPVWITAPTALLGLAQGLLAVPFAHYVFGFKGALLTLGLMMAALICAEAEVRIWEIRSGSREASLRPLLASPIAAVAVAILIGSAWYAGRARGQTYEDESIAWSLSSPGTIAIKRAQALAAPDVAEDQEAAYRLGAEGPTKELTPARELEGGLGIVRSPLTPFANGATRTFEGWALQESDDVGGAIFGGDAIQRPPIFRVVAGTGDVQLFTANGTYATWPRAWPGAGEWTHWGLVFDQGAGEAELFIDGESAGVKPQAQPYDATAGTFQLGSWGLFRNEPWLGRMAGVAVYEDAISAKRLRDHFEAAREGEYSREVIEDDPAVFWDLGMREGIVVPDGSGEGNDGELVWYG